jgi:hypothetical protein
VKDAHFSVSTDESSHVDAECLHMVSGFSNNDALAEMKHVPRSYSSSHFGQSSCPKDAQFLSLFVLMNHAFQQKNGEAAMHRHRLRARLLPLGSREKLGYNEVDVGDTLHVFVPSCIDRA